MSLKPKSETPRSTPPENGADRGRDVQGETPSTQQAGFARHRPLRGSVARNTRDSGDPDAYDGTCT